jgi:hypothetical protein
MRPTIKLKALFIYSKKDAAVTEDLKAYLGSMNVTEYVSDIQYQEIEALAVSGFHKKMEEVDLFFFLMSMDLLTHDFFSTSLPVQLIKMHNMDRLCIIPIQFKEVMRNVNIFKKKKSFPLNGKPIDDRNWDSYDRAYVAVFTELKSLLFERQQYKNELESAWKQAKKDNSIIGYEIFLEDYKLSKYATEAERIRKELVEEKLWKEAKATDTVKSYFEYIRDCPLQKHIFEAARHIFDIEYDESKNWEDTMKNDQLKFHYRYKNKFPAGQQVPVVNAKLAQELPDYNKLEEVDLDQLNSNYLDYYGYIHANLEAKELFSLHTFRDHFNTQTHKNKKQIEKLQTVRVYQMLAIPTLYIFYIMINILLPDLFEDLGRSFSKWWDYFLFQVVFVLGVAQLIWSVYWAQIQLERDKKYLVKAINYLQSLSVLCKVYISLHDQKTAKNFLEFARLLEFKTAKVEAKNFWSYIVASRRPSSGADDLPKNF